MHCCSTKGRSEAVQEMKGVQPPKGTLDKITVLVRQLEDIINSEEWRELKEEERERTCMVLSNLVHKGRLRQ